MDLTPPTIALVAIVFMVLVVVLNDHKKTWKSVVVALIFSGTTIVVIYGVVHGIKALVPNNKRPCYGESWCPHSGSFPSTHEAMASAMVVCLVLWFQDKKSKVVAGIVGLLFMAVVGMWRIMFHYHYPLDIVGGAIIGGLIGLISFYCCQHLQKHLPSSS